MASSKTRVYFTIDTETSMGGAWSNSAYRPLSPDLTVFGRAGSACYGIPLIMTILEEHGFRGTFFTEVFCGYNVGFEPVAAALRLIQSRGHDAQLHLHPEQRFYRDFLKGGPRREEGLLYRFPPAEQEQLIREAVQLFSDLSGKAPKAYRAGCYGASEITLPALRENGIEIDSSYNLAYIGDTCGFTAPLLNAPVVMDGIREFPVTVFRVAGVSGHKPLEISAVSVREIMTTICRMQRAGVHDIVLVLHSFSLLKNGGVRYEHCVPDRVVIARLKNLCAILAQMKDEIEVRVLAEAPSHSSDSPQVIPAVPWSRACVRKIVQAANRLPWL